MLVGVIASWREACCAALDTPIDQLIVASRGAYKYVLLMMQGAGMAKAGLAIW